MRKWLFALGLILFFVGIIFASSAVQLERTIREEENLIKSETDTWQISNNFTQGEKVKLVVDKGVDWAQYLEGPVVDVPYNHKFVYVNITAPNGEAAMFEVAFAEYQGALALYHVKIVASNGFDADNSSRGIVGYVRETGLHTATVMGSLPPGGSPPAGLTFFTIEEIVFTNYPYSYLLYPGVATLLAGIVLSIIGKMTSKRVQRKRRIRSTS